MIHLPHTTQLATIKTNAGKEYITDKETKEKYADDVWEMLQHSYKSIGGYQGAKSADHLVSKTYLWKIITKGDTPVAIGIYKQQFGLKRIAIGTAKDAGGEIVHVTGEDKKVRVGKAALTKLVKSDLKTAWVETSGGSEKLIMKVGGSKYRLPNTDANALTGKEILDMNDDGFHYTRDIGGEPHEKIIIGTPRGYN